MTREEAIERLKNYTQYRCGGVDLVAINMAIQALEQESKTGHWIEEFNDTEGEVRFTCSSCGEYQMFETDFCPNCGAEMRTEREDKE